MEKSKFFEAGIAIYKTYDEMVECENYLRSTNQRTAETCYLESCERSFQYINGEFVELKIVVVK